MLRALVPLAVLAAACSGSSAPATEAKPTIHPSPTTTVVSATAGDVDGDFRPDVVTVTPSAVSVQLSRGGSVSAPLVETDTPMPVLSGFADVDGDHRYEVFVETARGAAASFVQIYRYDGKSLNEVTSGGAPIRFGIGGTITHGEGFSCPGHGVLVVRRAETLNGTGFTLRTRTYALVGDVLALQKETTVTAPSIDDERVSVAFEVDCGTVGEGGS